MRPVLAAGSLRGVWPALMAAWQAQGGTTLETRFGPAGLLRERIEAGEPCALFASANLAHPRRLQASGRARALMPFASNTLNLAARSACVRTEEDWEALLRRADLRLGTSTAGSDPSGDYTAELLARLTARWTETAAAGLRARTRALVGGRDTLTPPAHRLAAEWLISEGHCDLFIGYRSYAPRLRHYPDLRLYTLPEDINPPLGYWLAQIDADAAPLAAFLTGGTAQLILADAGFGPPLAEPVNFGNMR